MPPLVEIFNNPSPNLAFRTNYSPFFTLRMKKSKKNKKTPDERYKEMRKDLARCLNIKGIKKIDGIMKPYFELRDEQLLRDILNKTKHIHVCHEMRNWIEDYIIEKK